MTDRRAARQLAAQAVAAGQPLSWFEQLYSAADRDGSPGPWADHEPNPNLLGWGRLWPAGRGRALAVGRGDGVEGGGGGGRGGGGRAWDCARAGLPRGGGVFPGGRVG